LFVAACRPSAVCRRAVGRGRSFVRRRYVCPAETPEGQAVGLVKNLSLMAYVSVGCPTMPILEVRNGASREGVAPFTTQKVTDTDTTPILEEGAPQSSRLLNPLRCDRPDAFDEFLEEWSTEPLEDITPSTVADPTTTKIFVNGNWVGIHRDPQNLCATLRSLRRQARGPTTRRLRSFSFRVWFPRARCDCLCGGRRHTLTLRGRCK
jgi:DNA-directed RNA polymerase beta subunit